MNAGLKPDDPKPTPDPTEITITSDELDVLLGLAYRVDSRATRLSTTIDIATVSPVAREHIRVINDTTHELLELLELLEPPAPESDEAE